VLNKKIRNLRDIQRRLDETIDHLLLEAEHDGGIKHHFDSLEKQASEVTSNLLTPL
jgi:hypothetical protein